MASLQSTTLESLCPEVMLGILDSLSPTWIINLWLTGARQLRFLLSERASITSLTLRGLDGLFTPSRLPGMLASLKSLTSLSISLHRRRIADSKRIWSCLSHLSKLKSLLLDFDFADEWMFDLSKLDAKPSSNLEAYVINRSHFAKIRPLAATFPHLESLEMTSTRATLLSHEHVSALPPSLTTLKLYFFPYFDEESLIDMESSLPRLTTLVIDAPICGVLKHPLPPSLTSLTFTRAYDVDALPSFWTNCNLVELAINLNLAPLAHLPPSLEILTLFRLDAPAPVLAHLPRLRCLNVTGHTNYNTFHWPVDATSSPVIEKLQYRPSNSTNDLDLKLIPRTLKSLNIHWSSNADPTAIASLLTCCTGLTELEMFAPLSFRSEHLLGLPATLTSLKYASLVTLNVGPAILKLPRSLKTLRFVNGGVSSSFLCHLPGSLVDFQIGVLFSEQFADSERADHILQLPRSITKLQLDSLDIRAPANAPWSAEMVANLPKVRYLTLTDDHVTIWSKEMASKLPQSLLEFDLTSAQFLPDALASLPQRLEKFAFAVYEGTEEEDESALKGEHLSLLPRSLLHLSLHTLGAIENHHLALLPPRLSTFSLPGRNLTSKALRFLPLHCKLSTTSVYDAQRAQSQLVQQLARAKLADPDPRVIKGQTFDLFSGLVSQ